MGFSFFIFFSIKCITAEAVSAACNHPLTGDPLLCIGIFLPKFNVKEDELVYDIFKSLYKDKNIKMIETKNINYGGGNIHCVTMNVPKI